MGLYINPKDGGHFEWLAANEAKRTSHNMALLTAKAKLSDKIPLALVQNPGFTALAILFDAVEAKRLLFGRPDAVTFLVSRNAVKEYLP